MGRNPFTILLALTALVLAMAAPATAQSTVDEYIAEAAGDGYSIEILGDLAEDSIFGGVTEVEVTSDPSASAFGVGTSLADDTESSAFVSQDGASESDVDNCAVPDMPADELQFIGDLLNSCSSAEAAVADGLPSAAAEADGLDLHLSGDVLVDVLSNILLAALDEQLDPVVGEVEDAVLDQVIAELVDGCETAIGNDNGDANGLFDMLEDLVAGTLPLDDLGDLLAALDEFGSGESPCELLEDLLLIVGLGDDGLFAALADLIEDALEGQTLLQVLLAGSESAAAATAGEVNASADAVGLYVELLPLEVLGTVVMELEALVDVLEDILDELGEQVPEELEPLAELLDQLDLEVLLTDGSPLLAITAGETGASATFDRTTGDVSTSATAVGLRVEIAASIAALLGQEPAIIEIEEGDEQAIELEGFTLARIAAASTVEDDDAERDGLPGATASATAAALSLIEFEEGSWVLDVAAGASHAAVFGEVEEAVAEAPPLPITGGGFALLAVALLGAGLLLRGRES